MKVFCILGDKRIFRSKSPTMFNTVLKRIGMNGIYVPFGVEPEQIGKAVQSLKVLNIAGANVTVPYKESVIPHLDVLSEGANIIGAINTIVFDGDIIKGYNTNAIGFMDALNKINFDVAGKSALVFGTGGAAKAVVFILNWLRATPTFITGRNEEKVRQMVNRFSVEAKPLETLADQPIPANIVVNATTVSSPDESPELASLINRLEVPGCELVIDLNYDRPQNFWQDMAEDRGIQFMDGFPILAYQAIRTLELWTKVKVGPEEFINALKQ
jgi:shikimate dehydrogenase